MNLTIGVDVGGTKIAAGVVDERGTILDQLRYPTPSADSAQCTEAVVGAICELAARYPVTAAGIGAAAYVTESGAEVLFAPHLPWRHEPVATLIGAATGLPVLVENDANAAAWAEATLGAGRGQQQMMLIGVGTGIGAGLVINGELYRGRWGIAGEPGHMQVVAGGRRCDCGCLGCWEQYASGSALVAEAKDTARRAPETAATLLRLCDGTADGITGSAVTAAASQGDAAALHSFEIIGGWLGAGLASLAAILDPGCFVIGGGVSDAGELLLAPARAAFRTGLTGGGHRPEAVIVAAELGPDAGLIGAACLARRLHGGDGAAAGRTAPGAASAAGRLPRNASAGQTTAP